jgi:hypothetical protein
MLWKRLRIFPRYSLSLLKIFCLIDPWQQSILIEKGFVEYSTNIALREDVWVAAQKHIALNFREKFRY